MSTARKAILALRPCYLLKVSWIHTTAAIVLARREPHRLATPTISTIGGSCRADAGRQIDRPIRVLIDSEQCFLGLEDKAVIL